MKVTSVTIENIHGVDTRTYDFDNIQYITGPNAAGKSTILQSIQLALLGYIPGTGKRISDVFKHSNGKHMAVTLKLDDAGSPVVVERTWAASKSSPISNVTVTPDMYDLDSIVKSLELPIFNFSEFMQLSANAMKDYFTNLIASETDESEINWRGKISEFSEDVDKVDPSYIDSIIDYVAKRNYKGLEEIKQMNSYLKMELSAQKDAQKRNQQTIQNLIYHKNFKPEYSTEDEYVKQMNQVRSIIQMIDAYRLAKNQFDAVKTKLDTFDTVPEKPKHDSYTEYDQYKEYVTKIQELQEAVSKLSDDRNALQSDIIRLESSKSTYADVINGKGICPFTKESCESIKPLVQQYEDKVAEIEEQISEKQKVSATIFETIKETSKQISELQIKMQMFERKFNDKLLRYDSYMNLKNQLESINVPDVDENTLSTDWDAELKKLTSDLAIFKANKEYNRLVNVLNAEKSKIELRIELLKAWIDLTSVNKMQAEMSTSAFRIFAEYINNYSSQMFADDSKFEFYLENKANTFTFGLNRNNKFIPYDLLSSVVKQVESPLKLIMIDDMLDHLDDVNMKTMIDVAKMEPEVQYIFAGVKDASCADVKIIQL